MTTDDTSRSPSLGGEQREGPTGREPGLPRLYRNRYFNMSLYEILYSLNDTQKRLLACDYADKLTSLQCVDRRIRDAIITSRRYANGETSINELKMAGSLAWAIVTILSTRGRTINDPTYEASISAAFAAEIKPGVAMQFILRNPNTELRLWVGNRAVEYLTGRAE